MQLYMQPFFSLAVVASLIRSLPLLSLREKCPNMDWIQKNTDQKELCIWKLSCSVHKTILWIHFQNCMCNFWEKREADLTIWHMFLASTRGYLLGKSRPFERYSEITWPAADSCVICLCLHNAELFS